MARPVIQDSDAQQYWSLVQRIKRLELSAQPEPSAAPALSTNWSAFGGAFGGASFYKHGGTVYLSGLVKKSVAVVSGETLFTLPVGYRPAATEILVTISNNALGRIDVTAAGAVLVQTGDAVWLTLGGLSFRAA